MLALFAFALVLAAVVLRDGRSDRADLGWLLAALAAICLAVVTERTPPRDHVGGGDTSNDLGVSAGRR